MPAQAPLSISQHFIGPIPREEQEHQQPSTSSGMTSYEKFPFPRSEEQESSRLAAEAYAKNFRFPQDPPGFLSPGIVKEDADEEAYAIANNFHFLKDPPGFLTPGIVKDEQQESARLASEAYHANFQFPQDPPGFLSPGIVQEQGTAVPATKGRRRSKFVRLLDQLSMSLVPRVEDMEERLKVADALMQKVKEEGSTSAIGTQEQQDSRDARIQHLLASADLGTGDHAWLIQYYLKNSEKKQQPEPQETDQQRSLAAGVGLGANFQDFLMLYAEEHQHFLTLRSLRMKDEEERQKKAAAADPASWAAGPLDQLPAAPAVGAASPEKEQFLMEQQLRDREEKALREELTMMNAMRGAAGLLDAAFSVDLARQVMTEEHLEFLNQQAQHALSNFFDRPKDIAEEKSDSFEAAAPEKQQAQLLQHLLMRAEGGVIQGQHAVLDQYLKSLEQGKQQPSRSEVMNFLDRPQEELLMRAEGGMIQGQHAMLDQYLKSLEQGKQQSSSSEVMNFLDRPKEESTGIPAGMKLEDLHFLDKPKDIAAGISYEQALLKQRKARLDQLLAFADFGNGEHHFLMQQYLKQFGEEASPQQAAADAEADTKRALLLNLLMSSASSGGEFLMEQYLKRMEEQKAAAQELEQVVEDKQEDLVIDAEDLGGLGVPTVGSASSELPRGLMEHFQNLRGVVGGLPGRQPLQGATTSSVKGKRMAATKEQLDAMRNRYTKLQQQSGDAKSRSRL